MEVDELKAAVEKFYRNSVYSSMITDVSVDFLYGYILRVSYRYSDPQLQNRSRGTEYRVTVDTNDKKVAKQNMSLFIYSPFNKYELKFFDMLGFEFIDDYKIRTGLSISDWWDA